MSDRVDMSGDDGTGLPNLEEMTDMVLRSLAGAELRVGFIHDVLLHEEYGQTSVALPISTLDGDGKVSTVNVWIPPEEVPRLRRVLRKLSSPEVLRHVPDPSSGLRTPPERSVRRPGRKRRR